MLYTDLENLIKAANSRESKEADSVVETPTNVDDVDQLVNSIDVELGNTLEKRASMVGIAKLLAALDILE